MVIHIVNCLCLKSMHVYMQVNLNFRNYIWFYKMPIILCKFSNSFLLSNDTEDTECHNNLELHMVIKNEFTSIFCHWTVIHNKHTTIGLSRHSVIVQKSKMKFNKKLGIIISSINHTLKHINVHYQYTMYYDLKKILSSTIRQKISDSVNMLIQI